MDVWIHSGKGRLRWIGTLVWHLQTVKCKLHSKWEAAVELREHSAVLRDDLEAGIKLEGRLRGRECMYTHGWFTLLGSRNQHYIVNQLFSNLKKKKLWENLKLCWDSRDWLPTSISNRLLSSNPWCLGVQFPPPQPPLPSWPKHSWKPISFMSLLWQGQSCN